MSYALENFAVRKVENKQFRITVEISDSSSPTPKTILDRPFSVYIFPVIILMSPIAFSVFFLIQFILAAGTTVLDSIKNLISPPYQPSYEEAKKWFEDGNGCLANLSAAEKEELRIKKDLPLGL